MRIILHIIRKEFIQIRRDRRMLIMSFVSPVLQLLILGYAANLDVNNIPLLVCDQDMSQSSREFVARFTSSGQFRIVGYVATTKDATGPMDKGRASITLVVPHGFESDVLAHRTVQVQAIADGSESNSAGIGLGYAALIVGQYSKNVLLQTLDRLGVTFRPATVTPQIRIWYNPTLKSRNFMVPAVLAMVLLMMTMSFTSLAVVREKETGTMEQLIVTPIKPYQLIIGKLAPFSALGIMDVVLVLLIATLWFHVPMKGSILLMFGLCFVFEIATLGLGLLISTVARTQQEATMTTPVFHHAAHDATLRLCLPDCQHAQTGPGHHLLSAPALLHDHHPRHLPQGRRPRSALARCARAARSRVGNLGHCHLPVPQEAGLGANSGYRQQIAGSRWPGSAHCLLLTTHYLLLPTHYCGPASRR